MNTNTKSARHERVMIIPQALFVAVVAAAVLIGFAASALADMALPSTPIGAPPMLRVRAVPSNMRVATVKVHIAPKRTFVSQSSGSCYAEPGTPPASVLHRESRGNPRARNASGAAGCWQFMPGTWGGYRGYASADQAPVSVQNERAKQVWAGGAGARHWRATCC